VGPAAAQSPIDQAVPLVRRALKVLSDREVSPQLGLLKSTLLQLDSTFSERTYGVSSFRDFAQKLATAGHVRLREHGRNVLVELADGNGRLRAEDAVAVEAPERRETAPEPAAEPAEAPGAAGEPRAADGIREVRRIFQSAPNPPRFPMYLRQAKQFMRSVDPSFDERRFGFGTLQDLLRACQREGLFRIERDRQGIIRLFPGTIMQAAASRDEEALRRDAETRAGNYSNAGDAQGWGGGEEVPPSDASAAEPVDEYPPEQSAQPEPEVVDGAIVRELEEEPVVEGEEAPSEAAAEAGVERGPAGEAPTEAPQRGRTTRRRSGAPSRARKTAEAPKGDAPQGRARKTASRTRPPRGRVRKTPAE
jgi:hypothetical protein